MKTLAVRLVRHDGSLERYELKGEFTFPLSRPEPRTRSVYAAPHVVAAAPGSNERIDWERTIDFRRYLVDMGFGIAEAMDTAHRGGALGWNDARELIARSAAEVLRTGARIVAGAQTDNLPAGATFSLDEITNAYLQECEFVESTGATAVLMPSHHLVRTARGPEDYHRVYSAVLSQLERPAIIHWLGAKFDQALAGYWGTEDLDEAIGVCTALIAENSRFVTGVKLSLLDEEREIALRRDLPDHVHMYTGDDLHFPSLIVSRDGRPSDALLGVLDGIAPAAATAFAALDDGDEDEFVRGLEPSLRLSERAFSAPTPSYKVDLTFLAYLNGRQPYFVMLDGLEAKRPVPHLCELFILADQANLLQDPELSANRLSRYLARNGID